MIISRMLPKKFRTPVKVEIKEGIKEDPPTKDQDIQVKDQPILTKDQLILTKEVLRHTKDMVVYMEMAKRTVAISQANLIHHIPLETLVNQPITNK